MIIGITGTDGGGKGTVVEYLVQKKGFIHCSARALWVDEIRKRGLEVNRANMRIVANELRATHGDDFLIAEYKQRTGLKLENNYVIESLRAIAEVRTLKAFGGVLWAVDADQKVRYDRIQSRASESDKISFEEFVEHEALEMNDPDPHGMQKEKVMQMANEIFQNNGTPQELFEQVEEALKNPKARS
ncbi:MAG: AAA family ATPase [Candidatus Adlerbacteria bacterium]|nr:AAA family ATPase [Candidatus Adlerbacteria bacterium]